MEFLVHRVETGTGLRREGRAVKCRRTIRGQARLSEVQAERSFGRRRARRGARSNKRAGMERRRFTGVCGGLGNRLLTLVCEFLHRVQSVAQLGAVQSRRTLFDRGEQPLADVKIRHEKNAEG
jgi:hypothetical protein